MINPLTVRRLQTWALSGLLLATVAGCHKLRSQLGSAGSTGPSAEAGDSLSKSKHLHHGGGGKKSHPPAEPASPDSREPSEASQSRHSRRPTQFFHWKQGWTGGGAGDHRYKGRTG